MPERSIGTVSKTVVPLRVPWVRIPPSPPAPPANHLNVLRILARPRRLPPNLPPTLRSVPLRPRCRGAIPAGVFDARRAPQACRVSDARPAAGICYTARAGFRRCERRGSHRRCPWLRSTCPAPPGAGRSRERTLPFGGENRERGNAAENCGFLPFPGSLGTHFRQISAAFPFPGTSASRRERRERERLPVTMHPVPGLPGTPPISGTIAAQANPDFSQWIGAPGL